MAEKSEHKSGNKKKERPDEIQLKTLSHEEEEGANPTSDIAESSPSQLSSSPGACVSQLDQPSSETASVEESQPDCQEETDGGASQASSTTKSKKGKRSEQKAEKDRKKQGRDKLEKEKQEREKHEKAERKAKEKEEKERKEKEKHEQKEKEKKEKREKELAKQIDRQRSKSFSVFGRKKNTQEKKSHVSPLAQRRHSDGQSCVEDIPCDDLSDENMRRQSHDLQNSGGACAESVNNLRFEVERMEEEIETLTAKQSEKNKEIATLRLEKAHFVMEVREALDKLTLQEPGKLQTHELHDESELENAHEEDARIEASHKKNIDYIMSRKAELESLQAELKQIESEVQQLTKENKIAKEKYDEIKSLQAKDTEEINHIKDEKLQSEHETENEIENWKGKCQQAEEEFENLQVKLSEQEKEIREETCDLPPNHHMEVKRQLERDLATAKAEHAREIAELKAKLEDKQRELIQSIEEANKLHRQLDETSKEHVELKQVYDEVTATKVDFEEKLKKAEERAEQTVQKKVNTLEKASRERHHKLLEENKQLKADVEELKKDVENYATLQKDFEEKDEIAKNLEQQLRTLKSEVKETEQAHKQAITSVKKSNECKQKAYEKQLEQRAAEIESLRDQLQQSAKPVLSEDQIAESELVKKLKADVKDNERRLCERVSEMAELKRTYDELSSDHKELQEKYGQLHAELRLKKHETAASAGGWIHSVGEAVEHGESTHDPCELQQQREECQAQSEDEEFVSLTSHNSLNQDNLTDIEKADLQRQLAEIQTEISNRDQRIKELEHQLAQLRQTKAATFVEERADKSDEGSDLKEKMIPSSKFAGLKEKYLEVTEKLVKFKEKYEREKKELLDKVEDRQTQLESAREVPPTTSPYVGDEPMSDKYTSLNSAVPEVAHLKAAVAEKDNLITSLKTQVELLKATAAERSELDEPSIEQNKTVVDWRKTFEAAEAERMEDHSKSEFKMIEAQKKITDLEEEIGVLRDELEAGKQNLQQEKEIIIQLERRMQELQEELQQRATVYDRMDGQLTHFKENATKMLKRFKFLLGKGEAEQSSLEKVESDDGITMKLNELMSELEAQKIQAETYKEDFEDERRDREAAATQKEEEIAAMQQKFSVTLKERNDLQTQLNKALDELESSKSLLKETIQDAEQSVQAHENEKKEDLIKMEDMERVIKYNQDESKREQARLNEKIQSLEVERAQLACDRDQQRENREKLKEERDDLKKQVQEFCDENERINCDLKAKVKEAEIFATERNHLENEYQHLQQQLREMRTEKDEVKTELAEVKQQLETVSTNLDETKQQLAAVADESRSKTQQVKQYKKQVDGFRTQLQESNAKIDEYHMRLEQCKKELLYCQDDLRKREEYEENTAQMVRAQYESELTSLKSELGRLKREKTEMEAHLRQISEQGALPQDAAGVVHKLEKEKAELYQKYSRLRDRYDTMFQRNDKLTAILVQNNISVPSTPSAKTPQPPPQPQHPLTTPYQGQLGYNTADPNKSVTSEAAIGGEQIPRVNQHGYGQRQNVVGGVPVVSHSPGVLRAGENVREGVVDGHNVGARRPNELYQGNPPSQGAYNQGQQNVYQNPQAAAVRGHLAGAASGGRGEIAMSHVNYPQGAARFDSGIPSDRNYGGVRAGVGVGTQGAEQQELIKPEPESGQRIVSGSQENALIKGINTEIHNVAAGVGREVGTNSEMDSLSPQAPFDPNLICPLCRLQYRIGEIQKYRKHVQYCQGTS